MVDRIEIFHEFVSLLGLQSGPQFFKDELVAVCDDPADERDMEQTDIVSYNIVLLLWQKARAACSTLAKVVCRSN